jgi:phosphatidylserine/phosphatidylglycerophosphate/cardiolipin synthase-like enzyme
MNYNPFYDSTNIKCNETKNYLEENGIKVKFIYTNWSVFTNVHNKGVIVDNKTVLISSINWNYNSFMNNREAGLIIENESIAKYYSEVFFYDWNLKEPVEETEELFQGELETFDYKNTIYIVVIYTVTFAIIIQDWRKREWT